jgi:hypothetical protein
MPEKDKQMLENLLQDKGKRYAIIIDSDDVSVVDKEDEDFDFSFTEFGEYLLKQVFEHLGLDADFC